MTPVEASFWRAEVDARLHSAGVVLDVLDRSPDWERLREAHRWAVASIPRLRQRPVEDPLHLGTPAWVGVDVDLDRHLSRITLHGGQFEDVLDVAAGLHMEPLSREHPLWRAILVDGLADRTACYLFKVHHSVADGTGIVQLFDLLHSDRARPTAKPPLAVPPPEDVTGTGLLVRRAAGLASAIPATAGRTAAAGVRALGHPLGTLRYAASARRVAAAPQARPSPLFAKRGLERELRVVEVPLSRLRDAGRAAGGSVNDAYIAGLLGGFRRYHEWHGAPLTDLPMALPVSHRRNDDLGGNHFSAASIGGPLDEDDPATRIREVGRRIRTARSEPALDLLERAAPLLAHLPSPLLAKAAAQATGSLDLQASNIPGLSRPSYIAGARITRMFVFGPAPGCAVMVTLLSHEGRCCIGITTDAAAVPDADMLAGCIDNGLQEIAALAGDAA